MASRAELDEATATRILHDIKLQSQWYRKKLAWRLYSEFYDEQDTLDIIGRFTNTARALRAVAYDLHRAERIYRAGIEEGRRQAAAEQATEPSTKRRRK
jgi:hypothetical protein